MCCSVVAVLPLAVRAHETVHANVSEAAAMMLSNILCTINNNLQVAELLAFLCCCCPLM